MAFINLISTALKLRKLRDTLVEEKLDALKIERHEEVKRKFRFRHLKIDIWEGIKRFFKRLFRISDNSRIYRFFTLLSHDGSYENFILKSLFGFISGVILTYIFYIFFIFQLNIKLTSSTIICSILGCILTVGLAFSSTVRCIVLLTLPQFFSKRGRQALLAYAFVLAITGPGQNTLNNMGILSESLSCGQEQVKQAVKQIIDVIKRPFVTIKETIKKVVKAAKEVIKKIKEIFMKIKRVVMSLVRVIKSAYEFLGSIINICNRELGTPFDRCSRVFEDAVIDCNAKLGPLFSWLCSLTYVVKAVCYSVKPLDLICEIVDFLSDSVVGVVIKKVKTFVRHIKTLFYVRIKFSHKFEYETVASKSLSQVRKEILAEIKGRTRGIVVFFKCMTSAAMMFFLYLIFQVAYYRYRYLIDERFDNIYITQYFRDLDRRRAKLGKETILPLTKKEKNTYVPIASAMLAYSERRELTRSTITLATASVKLALHMGADYALYWILTMVSYHGKYQSKIQAPNLPVAHIAGDGFISKLLRAIVDAFQPVGFQLEIDTVPCLPIPIPPDFDRYAQIGVTLIFCWILTVLEPYGLRIRNYIMGYYYPVRAKQRTIWLYNHLLRSRSSFLLFARRQLRRKFGHKGIDNVTCKEHFRAKLSGICAVFRFCLGSDAQLTCFLCGEVFREENRDKFIKCQSPNCTGLYCQECFEDLKNICPLCKSPIEYGDLDDVDEEKDSSDDEPSRHLRPPKNDKKCSLCLSCKKPKDDDDDEKKSLIEDEDDEEKEKDDADSDVSTEYSYSYQYDKDYMSPVPPSQTEFKDVERQHIPDYASMENFRHEDIGKQLKVSKGHTNLVKCDVVERIDGMGRPFNVNLTNIQGEIYDDDDNENEEIPLLSQECQCSSSSRTFKLIGASSESACICSELDFLEHFPTSSTITTCTETRECCCCKSNLKNNYFERITQMENAIPKLDLSLLGCYDEILPSSRRRFIQKFSNVAYEEVFESPRRLLPSASSSSTSELIHFSDCNDNDSPRIRRRQINRQPTNKKYITENEIKKETDIPYDGISSAIDSPSSMDSYEFHRTQNRKVKQYFEATRKVYPRTSCQFIKKKKFSFKDLFRKFLPKFKRTKRREHLPLHTNDINEEIELPSFNYSQGNCDILDVNFQLHSNSSKSSDVASDEKLPNYSHRIRGGECTDLINCNFIGRICQGPNPIVKSLDTENSTVPKHCLIVPQKPKENVKDYLSKYFLSIEDFTPNKDPGPSMPVRKTEPKNPFSDSSTEKENSNSFHSAQSTLNTLSQLPDQLTLLSSESGVSEDTCHALFGDGCPCNLRKDIIKRKQENLKIIKAKPSPTASQGEINSQNQESLGTIRKNQDSSSTLKTTESNLKQEGGDNQESIGTIKKNQNANSTLKITQSYLKQEGGDNQESLGTIKKNENTHSTLKTPQSNLKQKAGDNQDDQPSQKNITTDANQPEEHQNEPSMKETYTSPIPLQNQTTETDNEMNKSKSKHKIVETYDSFPLSHQDSYHDNSRGPGRTLLSRNENLQTSYNSFYGQLGNGTEKKTLKSSGNSPENYAIESRKHNGFSNDGYNNFQRPERDSSNIRNVCNCRCNCNYERPNENHNTQTMDDSQTLKTIYKDEGSQTIYSSIVTEPTCNCYECQAKEQHANHSHRSPIPPSNNFGLHHEANDAPNNMKEYSHTYSRERTPSSPVPIIYCPCNSCCGNRTFPQPPVMSPTQMIHDIREQHTRPLWQHRRQSHQYNNNNNNDEIYVPKTNLSAKHLPYQSNEDYMDLVQELEETLHSRNRNRVKKAMEEFERRSRQNKSLDKPINDYDETRISESEEPIIRRINELNETKKCCFTTPCFCNIPRQILRHPPPPSANSVGGYQNQKRESFQSDTMRQDAGAAGAWTMDVDSGEWIRANINNNSGRCPNMKSRNNYDDTRCPCNNPHCKYQ